MRFGSTIRRVASLLGLCAAVITVPARAASLRVAASLPDLAAIARDIGGPGVEVTALLDRNQDPHFADARPNLALALNRADLLLQAGLDLETGWLPLLVTNARNPAIQPGGRGHLDCGQFIHPLDVPTLRVDRSMGDIHPRGNPHYFHDPRAMLAVARGIATRMAELDPGRAYAYRANLAAFSRRLEAARRGWESRLAGFRGTAVVSYHKSWSYLCDWLGLRTVALIEPKPGIPPNPQHVAQVIVVARQKKARVVLRETYTPLRTAEILAAEIPARVVSLPAGADFRGGEGYIARMERVVTLLETALREATKTADNE